MGSVPEATLAHGEEDTDIEDKKDQQGNDNREGQLDVLLVYLKSIILRI